MSTFTKDNAMLLDIQYVKATAECKTDYLYIIWKNLDTGRKELKVIEKPKMEIYFEKPEFRNFNYIKSYERIENLDKRVVYYKDILFEIARDAGPATEAYLRECLQTRNFDGIKSLYLYNYVFGADYDIRVWWRHKWLQELDNSRPKPISKGFMDIEADIMEASLSRSNNVGEQYDVCPIDLVTIIDGDKNQSYTFALIGVECVERDMSTMSPQEKKKEWRRRTLYQHRIEQQEAVLNDVESLRQEAHEMFDEKFPGMEYNFYFYKDERKMLVHLFQLINTLKLDFMAIWNMPFDIPYIIGRMEALGLNPVDHLCHKDFPSKKLYFKRDKVNFDVKNKSDWLTCTSYTIFIDQMRNYAAIRKSGSELRGYSLDYVSEKEIGDKKLDYSDDGNIKTLSYHNYRKYVLYNIKDVLLQKGIEDKTDDIGNFYFTSYKNITPYENEYKQTLKLRNVQYASYISQGLVPGENPNIFFNKNNDSDSVGFEGALVGDPSLNDYIGAKLYNQVTNNIFRFCIDMDMARFYPSCIAANNIEGSTLIFKAIVNATLFENRGGKCRYHGITDHQINPNNSDTFIGDIAKEIFDNFQTRNYVSTGHKWLNLPSTVDVFRELQKRKGLK